MTNFVVFLAGETGWEGYYGDFFLGVPEVFFAGETALWSVLARREEQGVRLQSGCLAIREEGLPEKLTLERIRAGWDPAWKSVELRWLDREGKPVHGGDAIVRVAVSE